MKISLCMMVRNEAELIAKAIASSRGLADEVIIVDTGSIDATIAEARKCGATVIEGGDRRDKAGGRNLGLDAATGDWVVILDADERIADPVGMRTFLETATAQCVYIRESYMDANDQVSSWFHQARVWRRGVLRYQYRAHEVPVPPIAGAWPTCVNTDFVWEHRPPADRAWKREHMLMLLLMDVEENPGAPRPLFYLGREYMYLKAWDAAKDTLKQYLAVAEAADREQAEAFGHLATCYLGLVQPIAQRQALHQALALQPERRDWYGWLATAYHDQKLYAQAAGLLQTLLTLPASQTGYVNSLWAADSPHVYDLLARSLFYAGQVTAGLPYAQRACELAPRDRRLQENLAWFEGVKNGNGS
jgi:tetratricopeptide (TPR) repeat protein